MKIEFMILHYFQQKIAQCTISIHFRLGTFFLELSHRDHFLSFFDITMSVLKICSECRTTVWLSSFCTWEIKKLLSIIINFFCGKFVKSPTFKLIHQLLSNRMCSFISWITIKFNGSHWPDQIYPFYVLKKAVSMLSRAADDGNFLPIMGRTS